MLDRWQRGHPITGSVGLSLFGLPSQLAFIGTPATSEGPIVEVFLAVVECNVFAEGDVLGCSDRQQFSLAEILQNDVGVWVAAVVDVSCPVAVDGAVNVELDIFVVSEVILQCIPTRRSPS
jgi:hypothetical protein